MRDCFEFRTWGQAADLQSRLAGSIVEQTPSRFKPILICGLDLAYLDDLGFAAGVLWDLQSERIVATSKVVGEVGLGYAPGFLGFREGPLVVAAARKLSKSADVFMVDGHGRVHPRRFGLACHVGLALGKPTVGVAKSQFYGNVEGDSIVSPEGTLLGKVVRTNNGRPYYVSVGNRISLDNAAQLVKQCIVNDHAVPLREAHLEAARLRRAG
jgi:deoxyribonuclease V